MALAESINVALNLGTAGLVAYTARTLKHLRDNMQDAASELREHHAEERQSR